MEYELCEWGFIVGAPVVISTHPTREDAAAALKAEWSAREKRGQYTDMGTFKLRAVTNMEVRP